MFADGLAQVNQQLLSTLGESVLLDGVTVQAFYSDPYAEAPLDIANAAGSSPELSVLTSSVAFPVSGKPVVARAKNYKVAEYKSDSEGVTVLVLEKV